MDRTRISSKGQIVIPKQIRDRHQWWPGTELAVIDAPGGVLPIDRLAAPVKLGKKDFR